MAGKKRKIRFGFLCALAAMAAAGLFTCAGYAFSDAGEETFSVPELPAGTSAFVSSSSAGFEYTPLVRIPKRYSLLEKGKKPAVRSQGNLNTCWAITACSAVESALLPQQEESFSPDHMSLRNGYDAVQGDGGDYHMIMAYLAGRRGPVPETEDPYGDGISPEDVPASYYVRDIRLLRGMARRQICQMIMTYGAAQSSLAMDRMRTDSDSFHYYNEDTFSYYDPFPEELNHDILVLGWDDTYSRENFRIRPKNDGAWICQNTWGGDFGENGIFYVSYEDRNLFRKGGIVYNSIVPAQEGEQVCEQDALGWLGRQGYGRETCWFAGVFHSARSEAVSGIGFYTTGPYTSYSIWLIPDYTGSEDLAKAADPDGGTDPSKSADPDESETPELSAGGSARILAAGQITNPGFHTVSFPGEVLLRKGQTYAVAVRIDTPGAENPVAVELAKDSYTKSVTTEGRETYLSKTGKHWENTQKEYSTNVCLKVFTSARDAFGQ